MPLPAPLATVPSPGKGEAAAVAVSPTPLSARKAKSLDVHVPSLRQRPTGVCRRVTWLARALLPEAGGKLGLMAGAPSWGDPTHPLPEVGPTLVLPQDQQPPRTLRAACVWSMSRRRCTPRGGPGGCWPRWNVASGGPGARGTRPCPGRTRCGLGAPHTTPRIPVSAGGRGLPRACRCCEVPASAGAPRPGGFSAGGHLAVAQSSPAQRPVTSGLTWSSLLLAGSTPSPPRLSPGPLSPGPSVTCGTARTCFWASFPASPEGGRGDSGRGPPPLTVGPGTHGALGARRGGSGPWPCHPQAQCRSASSALGEKRSAAEQRGGRRKVRLVSRQVGKPPRTHRCVWPPHPCPRPAALTGQSEV